MDDYKRLKADAAAEWLRDVRRKSMNSKTLLYELQAYEDSTGVKGTDYSAVRVSSSPTPDGVHDMVVRYMELKAKHETAAVEFSAAFYEAKRIIDSLTDSRHRMLLSAYFLQGRTWDWVAQAMCYDVRRVYDLRLDALCEVHDIMPREFQVKFERAD